MRLHEFDLNLLLYLDALLAEQGVSKAAARVHISQPAMSLALLRLRKHFGDELLVSIAGRTMVLTPLAKALIGPVREVVLRVQAIAVTIPNFDPQKSQRTFKVMASGYATEVLLNRLMGSLSKDAPRIRIELHRLTFDDRQQIRRADLDLLIAPRAMIFEDLPSETLWQDEPVAIVWSKNSVVGSGRISLEQYRRMGHACVMLDGHRPCLLDLWFQDQFGARRVEVVVPEMPMIPRAIEGTDRISVVYSRMAQLYVKQCSLRLIRPPIHFPSLDECMQWHPLEDQDPELVWFRNYVRNAVKTFDLNSSVGMQITPRRASCG